MLLRGDCGDNWLRLHSAVGWGYTPGAFKQGLWVFTKIWIICLKTLAIGWRWGGGGSKIYFEPGCQVHSLHPWLFLHFTFFNLQRSIFWIQMVRSRIWKGQKKTTRYSYLPKGQPLGCLDVHRSAYRPPCAFVNVSLLLSEVVHCKNLSVEHLIADSSTIMLKVPLITTNKYLGHWPIWLGKTSYPTSNMVTNHTLSMSILIIDYSKEIVGEFGSMLPHSLYTVGWYSSGRKWKIQINRSRGTLSGCTGQPLKPKNNLKVIFNLRDFSMCGGDLSQENKPIVEPIVDPLIWFCWLMVGFIIDFCSLLIFRQCIFICSWHEEERVS